MEHDGSGRSCGIVSRLVSRGWRFHSWFSRRAEEARWYTVPRNLSPSARLVVCTSSISLALSLIPPLPPHPFFSFLFLFLERSLPLLSYPTHPSAALPHSILPPQFTVCRLPLLLFHPFTAVSYSLTRSLAPSLYSLWMILAAMSLRGRRGRNS